MPFFIKFAIEYLLLKQVDFKNKSFLFCENLQAII